MGSPPTGVVTLVFTDIEGSTRLLHELGDAYLGVLEEHNARVRRAMTSQGGTEIKNEGDGFLFAFTDPPSAVFACGDAQRALHAGGWPQERSVRVRIGAHLGPVTVLERDYVGLAVHEAHRVCSAASGGQVLVTEAVAQAVTGTLPAGIAFESLGSYRLRDFPEPRRLHQATIAGLPAEFPPLRSLAAQRTVALPEDRSPLVGRARELVELEHVLQSHNRLVSITGPGGVGKTRLAIEAAWRTQDYFSGGVWFVELAGATSSEAIVPTLLETVDPSDERSIVRLARLTGDRPALVVVDNLEQVGGAAAPLTELLDACPSLTIVTTSRSRLHAPGEREIALHGLDIDGAVELFMKLARLTPLTSRATDPEVIEDICRHVDGMPLAIELMAFGLRTRTPRELLGELRASLDVLSDDDGERPSRHRAMRATIAWSWDLLTPEEQQVLLAMSVTGGSAPTALVGSLAAAAGVEGDVADVVASLVDKSLATGARARGSTRVQVLHVIRQFAAEHLSDEPALEARLHEQYARWLGDLVAAADGNLLGVDAGAWLDRLDAERDNIRVALERTPREPILDELTTLVSWWTARGHWVEGRTVLERVLDAGVKDPALRANVLAHHASLALRTGAIDAACQTADEAFELVDSFDVPADVRSRTFNVLGEIARTTAEDDLAEARYMEALAAAPDDDALAVTLSNLGVLAWQSNRFADARRWWQDALATVAPIGDRRAAAILTSDLGLIDVAEGDIDQAEHRFTEALQTGLALDDPLVVAQGLLNLGVVAKKRGDEATARERYLAALEVYERTNDEAYIAAALIHLAMATDDMTDARVWLTRARDVATGCGDALRLREAEELLGAVDEIEAEKANAISG